MISADPTRIKWRVVTDDMVRGFLSGHLRLIEQCLGQLPGIRKSKERMGLFIKGVEWALTAPLADAALELRKLRRTAPHALDAAVLKSSGIAGYQKMMAAIGTAPQQGKEGTQDALGSIQGVGVGV